MIRRLALYCTLITFCTVTGFILYSNLFSPNKSFSAVGKYYTISNGEWSSNIWSDISNISASCSCAPTCNLATPALIRHKLSVSSCGSFAISGGVTVDINNGGNLTINSPFTLSGGSTLNVASSDTLLIYGNTTLSGGSFINMNGYMVIYGNLTMTGGSGICGTGEGYVTGSISGSGWCFTGTLPIELISFAAKKGRDNQVELDWSTGSETNNEYFTIERSSDGINFETIGNIPGAGNSSHVLNYKFSDPEPIPGTNYYRLRQTDFDGKSTLSKIVQYTIKSSIVSASFYPNPLKSGELAHFSSPFPIRSIRIYNMSNQLIIEKNMDENFSPASTKAEIETDNLKPGVYLYELNIDGYKIANGKMVIQ